MTRTRKPEYINEYGSNSEYGSSTRLCTQISEYGMATRTCFCTQISENLAQYRWDIRYIGFLNQFCCKNLANQTYIRPFTTFPFLDPNISLGSKKKRRGSQKRLIKTFLCKQSPVRNEVDYPSLVWNETDHHPFVLVSLFLFLPQFYIKLVYKTHDVSQSAIIQ